MLVVGDERILDDPGTGSYVDPTLHWYRSSLAHNAPFFDALAAVETEAAGEVPVRRGETATLQAVAGSDVSAIATRAA